MRHANVILIAVVVFSPHVGLNFSFTFFLIHALEYFRPYYRKGEKFNATSNVFRKQTLMRQFSFKLSSFKFFSIVIPKDPRHTSLGIPAPVHQWKKLIMVAYDNLRPLC